MSNSTRPVGVEATTDQCPACGRKACIDYGDQPDLLGGSALMRVCVRCRATFTVTGGAVRSGV